MSNEMTERTLFPPASLTIMDDNGDEDEEAVSALRMNKIFRDPVSTFLSPSPDLLTKGLLSKESLVRKH